jgi:hypothetical protein
MTVRDPRRAMKIGMFTDVPRIAFIVLAWVSFEELEITTVIL